MIPQAAAEYNVSHTYIDWLLSVPWGTWTEDRLDLEQATKVLDADHYNLKKIKERILEFLAVLQLKKDRKSPILCFVGPPGVGKTSLGQSIAKAMGRKFVRMSLGGIRDEAEIRGHRRTYVGALPGRIIQGLKKAGSGNPLFMLDEIDKIGTDFRGDPASALLEVLDPQQNSAFNDHYLELDYDLSAVTFIATANITDTIPPALLDRMEIMHLPGYTANEKKHIAKRFLIPRQLKDNGIKKSQLFFPMNTVEDIVTYYCREAGVRKLERTIGKICRKVARKIVEGKIDSKTRTTVTQDDLTEYLGPKIYLQDEAEKEPEVGLATGMAWTSVGGAILPVEITSMPGKGILQLTGSLGDVMKESAQAAFSLVKSRGKQYKIKNAVFAEKDFHIHVPDGATPKDGPSAGITIVTTLISHLTNRPVRPETAMTGEITLRGKVTPVGGIKEKVIAALSAGIKNVVLPEKNRKDLEDIPDDVRKKLKFTFVSDVDQALKFLLVDK
jgi:ATP-dependent Lon protease